MIGLVWLYLLLLAWIGVEIGRRAFRPAVKKPAAPTDRQSVLMEAGMTGVPNHRRTRSTLPGDGRRKAQRLLQKAKDDELAEFVAWGNRQWALNHLQARSAQQADRDGMIEDLHDTIMSGDAADPFDF